NAVPGYASDCRESDLDRIRVGGSLRSGVLNFLSGRPLSLLLMGRGYMFHDWFWRTARHACDRLSVFVGAAVRGTTSLLYPHAWSSFVAVQSGRIAVWVDRRSWIRLQSAECPIERPIGGAPDHRRIACCLDRSGTTLCDA